MYLNFNPLRQLELLTRYPFWLDTDSQEFKDRYIENPNWKKVKLEREVEQLKDRKKYYEDTADIYLKYAKETREALTEKEKKLAELK